ncbi:MAG: hypothetical protein A2499_17490 [Stygiobacter sp. RIFOXYC12_FULL_38_8]|nr:MAG: hypothetical protein A2X62_08740 [Stygiobacter sp. GWC2_38_9]OGU78126.1 MAG: hypothetical protein A2279_04975 [Stygiobacter sp. RIFOXYA12_FULL_38_9]OGV06800.1 MAG: hypothetical protein A2299_05305 [Stygiobacter sp. RIFOXYB2_FULL_37_11]OGV12326.1 MAG: hypothetical protein A2440_13770 [Stygiobacter sp. RIFOXYC2_FULL_38_25]OGV14635.1 MAG: hypothetical protein A2237_04350 [Stygiobacter sp. RIFOXYA2_FULL_38_8]OGV25195.1 MAG: hypothetical protein A2499_17490 [Stygiobacter sp. RIFOXYC12_FULL_
MIRVLKLAHFGGLVIFLGSIFTFTVISAMIEGASMENIAFGRKIISTGTNVLTLPGMWVLAVTGVWMGYKRYGLKQRFFQIKLLLITLVVINAYFFITPAATSATEIAVRSLVQGKLLPEYKSAYIQESIFGAVNVLLTVAAAVIGVWRIGAKSRGND